MVASMNTGVQTARGLRKSMTGIELLLWSRLRGHQLGGHKFRRQVPLGPFVVDFVCYASRLVVEVDGPAHEASMRQDALRDAYLGSCGFSVLRFSADDVLHRLDDVLRTILRECSWERSIPP